MLCSCADHNAVSSTAPVAKLTIDEFANFFRYYRGRKGGQPQQFDAVGMLYEAMPSSLLDDSSAWITRYRETPPTPDTENPLLVPYFWQQDNGPEGWRQCQTSSIAMCLAYLKTPGINDDVDYLKVVQKYGDTTLQSSHQQALRELGVKARFRTDGSKQDLIDRLAAGFPSAIGILHHGSVSQPSGGGHYIVFHGTSGDDHAVISDPYGELNYVTGQWEKTGQQDGKRLTVSWKNLLPRWDLNNGTNDGWYWEIG